MIDPTTPPQAVEVTMPERRLVNGQRWTAFEIADGSEWAVGIGPVSDFLGIARVPTKAVADWLISRLASTPIDPSRQSFLDAIHERTPTGAWIAVQHHPDGDWSVAEHPLPWLPGVDPSRQGAGEGIVSQVVELARRDVMRTQTDFLGRMGQALCTYEGLFEEHPDGELPDDAREEALDQISSLAGLALAQMAMLTNPDTPLTSLQHEGADGGVERLREGEWFYPEGDHSSDECRFSHDEVIDYALEGDAVSQVVAIERAASLPTVYAAVRVWTDAEKDERGSDDDYDYTLFATADEALAALSDRGVVK